VVSLFLREILHYGTSTVNDEKKHVRWLEPNFSTDFQIKTARLEKAGESSNLAIYFATKAYVAKTLRKANANMRFEAVKP
jgi:hypothetical protein